jgi:hypothetical protein
MEPSRNRTPCGNPITCEFTGERLRSLHGERIGAGRPGIPDAPVAAMPEAPWMVIMSSSYEPTSATADHARPLPTDRPMP